MLKLHAYGAIIPCDKAVKGSNYISAYKDGKIIREDSGITSFSGYSLTDEEGKPVVFGTPESSGAVETAIRAVVTAMTETGNLSRPNAESVMARAIEIAHG